MTGHSVRVTGPPAADLATGLRDREIAPLVADPEIGPPAADLEIVPLEDARENDLLAENRLESLQQPNRSRQINELKKRKNGINSPNWKVAKARRHPSYKSHWKRQPSPRNISQSQSR